MKKNRLSPHDRFFKAMMSQPEVIQEFFHTHLPADLKQQLDFSSLHLQKESFLDDALRLSAVDLLYKATLKGEPGFFYILIEHASTPQRLLPFRLLKYMIAIMEHYLKTHKEQRLPVVYPLVLYSGEKPYSYSLNLFDLFGPHKELAQRSLLGSYQLVDLTQLSDEELRPYQWFGATALLGKHIHDEDILPFLQHFMDVLRNLEKRDKSWYIFTMISYMVEAGQVSSKDAFKETIRRLETVDEEDLMTILDMFKPDIYNHGHAKGLEEGRQKGREEGKRESMQALTLALSLLHQQKPLKEVAEQTGLSLQELEEIRKNLN